MIKKIGIIHFLPIEKYPPVLNLINSIDELNNISSLVITTQRSNGELYKTKKSVVNRIVKISKNSFYRYYSYLLFNLLGFFELLTFKPKFIFVFETYSILPAFLYKLIFKNAIIHVHYHEYTSFNEIKSSSKYFKLLHFFEKKMFKKCNYISQTNSDRLAMFLNNYPFIEKNKAFVIPNIPPSNWYEFALQNKTINKSKKHKLVHVGALNMKTMYVKEIVNWVISQDGLFVLDFFTDNLSPETEAFIIKANSEYVNLYGSINYFELPNLLVNYDIGITLYNGYIPNHVYSIPNKVIEYLYCGLNVWYSSELLSTSKFIKNEKINGCREIDFSALNSFQIAIEPTSGYFNSNDRLINGFVDENSLLIGFNKLFVNK